MAYIESQIEIGMTDDKSFIVVIDKSCIDEKTKKEEEKKELKGVYTDSKVKLSAKNKEEVLKIVGKYIDKIKPAKSESEYFEEFMK